MVSHTHLKRWYQSEKTFDVYLLAQNQLHPSHFPWVTFFIAKILGTLGMPGYAGQKRYYQVIYTIHERLSCLSAGKKSTSSSILCWRFPAFWHITRETEIYQIWDWWWNISNNISFHFGLFQRKFNNKAFQKV